MANGEVRRTAAKDGALLQYEVLGPDAGPVVVFLHGDLDTRFTFRRQRDALADEFRLLLCDRRGYNGTEARIPDDYGIATTQVEDVRAILHAEGLERTAVHLVGHSTGGATAPAFARAYPEQVGRLVLIEPTLFHLLPPDLYAREQATFAAAAVRIAAEGVEAAIAMPMERLLGMDWRSRLRPEALTRLLGCAPMTAREGDILFDLPFGAVDLTALAAPTLFLYGAQSMDLERAIYERIGELRPDLPRMWVEGAGHVVHADQPDQVNTAIRSFLAA